MARTRVLDILPVVLPRWARRELELWGRTEVRDDLQQARWILQRVLAAHALAHGRDASDGADEPNDGVNGSMG